MSGILEALGLLGSRLGASPFGMMGNMGAGGQGGILAALGFPMLDPTQLGGGTPRAPVLSAAAASPLLQPTSMLNPRAPERAPAQASSIGTPSAPHLASPQTPRRPMTPAPAINTPALPSSAAPDLSVPNLSPNAALRQPSFLERLNAPMSDGNPMTPMDGLSLGMELMGAGQPSWNVNGPNGWTQAAQAVSGTVDRAQDRVDRGEQRDAFRAANERDATKFAHDQTEWGRDDQQRAATMAAINSMPEGPEKQWALANPEEFARITMQQHAQAGTQTVDGGFVWTRGADGTLTRGAEVPLSAAERAEHEARMAAVAAQNGAPHLTDAGKRDILNAVGTSNQLNHALQRVQTLMQGATTADLRIGGPRYAALQGAYTNLALLLKGPQMYNLGQLSGSDLRMLSAVVGDPNNFEQYVRDGGGMSGLQARLAQVQEGVDYSRSQLHTNYGDYAAQLPAGILNFDTAHAGDTPQAGQQFHDLPPPNTLAGVTLHDPDTNTYVRSDGTRWVQVAAPQAAPAAPSGASSGPGFYARPDGPMRRG